MRNSNPKTKSVLPDTCANGKIDFEQTPVGQDVVNFSGFQYQVTQRYAAARQTFSLSWYNGSFVDILNAAFLNLCQAGTAIAEKTSGRNFNVIRLGKFQN